ncbi:hypothetical protein NIES4074_56280 [Cylindrospermum sp. NIES-4074]|jgi:Spy/CpxP family protein refolding chaperone|nr:hypothetical protein NIES4074_56280 [Cylindrospermum sp. NIES-4074]
MMVASQQAKTLGNLMKLKALSFIAGAVALTLTAIPFAVQAQTAFSSPLLVAQATKKGSWPKLNLTDAQKNQIKEIRRSTRTQIEAVLTPEQREKLKAEYEARRGQRQQGQRPRQEGQGRRQPFASLNLTEGQKAEIKKIMESSKQQIQAVYTPEQREQLKQFRENARARRQQRQG